MKMRLPKLEHVDAIFVIPAEEPRIRKERAPSKKAIAAATKIATMADTTPVVQPLVPAAPLYGATQHKYFTSCNDALLSRAESIDDIFTFNNRDNRKGEFYSTDEALDRVSEIFRSFWYEAKSFMRNCGFTKQDLIFLQENAKKHFAQRYATFVLGYDTSYLRNSTLENLVWRHIIGALCELYVCKIFKIDLRTLEYTGFRAWDLGIFSSKNDGTVLKVEVKYIDFHRCREAHPLLQKIRNINVEQSWKDDQHWINDDSKEFLKKFFTELGRSGNPIRLDCDQMMIVTVRYGKLFLHGHVDSYNLKKNAYIGFRRTKEELNAKYPKHAYEPGVRDLVIDGCYYSRDFKDFMPNDNINVRQHII